MSAGGHCFQPVEPFTIFGAIPLKDMLLEQLSAHPDGLVVDLSAVQEIDTAGVQLLLMLKREAELRDCPVSFQAPSTPVRDMFTLLGLSADFMPGSGGYSGQQRRQGG